MTQVSLIHAYPYTSSEFQEVRFTGFVRLAAGVLVAALTIVASVALFVWLTGSVVSTRARLHLGLGHPPETFASFGSIALANLTVAIGPLLLGALIQVFIRCAHLRPRALIAISDLVVVYLALSKLLLELGESIGAYGWRVLIDVLSHGPLELSGFALFWSVYFACRRGRVEGRAVSLILLLAVSLIAIAATLETWAHS